MFDLSAAREMAKPVEEPKPAVVVAEKVNPVSQDPMFILTPWATIAVYGHEHVSKRTMELMGLIMNQDDINSSDHNVRAIMLRTDGQPKKADGTQSMAGAAYGFGTISLNLKETFRICLEKAKENKLMSIQNLWHDNTIMNLLHEINHMVMKNDASLDEKLKAENDELAETWARDTRTTLVQNHNLEPGNWRDEPYFHKAATEALTAAAAGTDEEKEWYKLQIHMLDHHCMYTMPADAEKGYPASYIHEYKKICQLVAGAPTNSPEWNKNTTGVAENLGQFLKETGRNVTQTPVFGGVNGYDGEYEYEGMGVDTIVRGPEAAYVQPETYHPPIQPQHPAPWTPEQVHPNSMQEHVKNSWNGYNGQPNHLTYTKEAVGTMQPTGFTVEQAAEIAKSVYYKAYRHIFEKCGPQKHSDKAFAFEENVTLPVPLTPDEQKVVFMVDCMTQDGQLLERASTLEGLRGMFYKESSKLPVYKLYINMGGDKPIMRKLLPQNTAPNLKKAVQTESWHAARNGAQIMYIAEADPELERERKSQNKSNIRHWIKDGAFASFKD